MPGCGLAGVWGQVPGPVHPARDHLQRGVMMRESTDDWVDESEPSDELRVATEEHARSLVDTCRSNNIYARALGRADLVVGDDEIRRSVMLCGVSSLNSTHRSHAGSSSMPLVAHLCGTTAVFVRAVDEALAEPWTEIDDFGLAEMAVQKLDCGRRAELERAKGRGYLVMKRPPTEEEAAAGEVDPELPKDVWLLAAFGLWCRMNRRPQIAVLTRPDASFLWLATGNAHDRQAGAASHMIPEGDQFLSRRTLDAIESLLGSYDLAGAEEYVVDETEVSVGPIPTPLAKELAARLHEVWLHLRW